MSLLPATALNVRSAAPATPAARRPLAGLLIAQFFGAFNDNAWKFMVMLLALRPVQAQLDASSAAYEAAGQTQTMLATLIFTLPLMLVSLPAGVLADRISKRSVVLALKGLEVALLAAGAAVLWWNPAGVVLPMVVLGAMGLQSGLFSPAKYGILPELLPHEKLSAGNGLMEMCTMLAIILGAAAGGLLLGAAGDRPWLAGAVLVVLSVVGLIAAMRVPQVAPARAGGGLRASVGGAWQAIRADRLLALGVAGSIVYWTVASFLGQNVIVYTQALLRGASHAEWIATLPLAVLGLGIAVGALLAGRLSANKVEFGLIPLGAAAMAAITLAIGLIGPGFVSMLVCLALLGVAGGWVVVPLNAVVQWRSPAGHRGGVIALSNVVIFAGTVAGSLAAAGLSTALGLSAQTLMLVVAGMLAASTLWAMWLAPEALLRLVLVLMTRTLYRLNVVGRANVPAQGGALLVANHLSLVDALLLQAGVDRPIRFLADADYYHRWWLHPIMRLTGAIPISATGGPRVVLSAMREAGDRLDAGELVGIFAEGQISRTGGLLPFRKGLERIVRGRSVPIVPVHLDGLWGSIFSHAGGRFLFKRPERLPYPVTVSFGEPMPTDTPASAIRQRIMELGCEARLHHAPRRRPLHRTFIRLARQAPRQPAFIDAQRGTVSRFKALVGSVALARELRGAWRDQAHVGVLLPPSAGGAMVNLAAAMAGRVSVNLNYTTGESGMASAARQAGLKTVVTSRAFLEKAGLDVSALLPGALPGALSGAFPGAGVELIFLEDVAAGIASRSRLIAMLLAGLAPMRLLERCCGARQAITPDTPVTVIFSSGSTAEPKGIVLSHDNLAANVQAVAEVFHLQSPRDRLLGILPLFHSFGYMTLWLAANGGVPSVFHPNPLDAAGVGEQVHAHGVTIVIATPTFLQFYLRRCDPGQFATVRSVLTGAEKLPERLALAFEQRFGVRPIEGYGSTECSPVVAVSVPDVRLPGIYQPGAKLGTVGRPLPGVAVRTVDPETFAPLPVGEPGLLLVRGANVMLGYLGRDDLTAQVMRHGWYVTGDIAQLDEDGFVRITDRLSRFSKIGGEMIPHGKLEDALHAAAGLDGRSFLVTAVEDEQKGERLAVLHTLDAGQLSAIIGKLAGMGLPRLFIPRPDQFIHVDQLPLLGSGKIDLRTAKTIAAQASRGEGIDPPCDAPVS